MTGPEVDSKKGLLFIGLPADVVQSISAFDPQIQFKQVLTVDEFNEKFELWADGQFIAIICGQEIKDLKSFEVGQILESQCPGTWKCFVGQANENYEPRKLIQNGFNSAFALPVDWPLLKTEFTEKVIAAQDASQKIYRSVQITDLQAGDKLDFETFIRMPANRKYICYTRANAGVSPTQIGKLKTSQVNQLWVDHREMPKFYRYTATKLKSLTGSGLSATERKEKMAECVHSILTDVFDQSIKGGIEQGRAALKQCETMVSSYITNGGASNNWYTKLMATMGESGNVYSHASNISSLAALFSIGLGDEHPEDLAIAGLFHDIGLIKLPHELQTKKESELSASERALFYTHPEESLRLVRSKRLSISTRTEEAILQHHEAFHGRGFPRQLAGDRISRDAQILAFADQFDELTHIEQGKVRLTAMQAVEAISKTGSIDPQLVKKIKTLLKSSANEENQEAKSG